MAVNTRLKFPWLEAAKRATHHIKAPQKAAVRSDSNVFAEWMVQHVESLIMKVRLVLNANATLASCPLAMTCTPANGTVFSAT